MFVKWGHFALRPRKAKSQNKAQRQADSLDQTLVFSNLERTRGLKNMFSPSFHLFSHGQMQKKRIVIRERSGTTAGGGGKARRGSGFSAALYPNPGFGNRMRRMQVNTNASNNSTDTGLVGGGEQRRVK